MRRLLSFPSRGAFVALCLAAVFLSLFHSSTARPPKVPNAKFARVGQMKAAQANAGGSGLTLDQVEKAGKPVTAGPFNITLIEEALARLVAPALADCPHGTQYIPEQDLCMGSKEVDEIDGMKPYQATCLPCPYGTHLTADFYCEGLFYTNKTLFCNEEGDPKPNIPPKFKVNSDKVCINAEVYDPPTYCPPPFELYRPQLKPGQAKPDAPYCRQILRFDPLVECADGGVFRNSSKKEQRGCEKEVQATDTKHRRRRNQSTDTKWETILVPATYICPPRSVLYDKKNDHVYCERRLMAKPIQREDCRAYWFYNAATQVCEQARIKAPYFICPKGYDQNPDWVDMPSPGLPIGKKIPSPETASPKAQLGGPCQKYDAQPATCVCPDGYVPKRWKKESLNSKIAIRCEEVIRAEAVWTCKHLPGYTLEIETRNCRVDVPTEAMADGAPKPSKPKHKSDLAKDPSKGKIKKDARNVPYAFSEEEKIPELHPYTMGNKTITSDDPRPYWPKIKP